MKNLSYLIQYLLLRFIQAMVTALPRGIALKMAAGMGHVLRLSGAYLKIVRKNMEFVNLWPPEEQERIIKKLYPTICRYAVDFLRSFPPLPPYVVRNEEIVYRELAKGTGGIILLAHFGNWEVLADIFGAKVPSLHVIAKPMRNPYVDRWLDKKRKEASVETIYTDQGLRRIFEVLRKNGIVAILIDQHAGDQGTMVPFLGKETSTVRSVAGLVCKLGCDVGPTYALLQDDNSYEIVFKIAPRIDRTGKTDAEVITAYQKQHNDIISDWIKENPHHWFGWFHKRFKESIKYR